MKRLSFLAAINASGVLQRQVSAVALRNELRPANISPGIVLFLHDRDRCLRIGLGGVVMGTPSDRRVGARHVKRLGGGDPATPRSSAGMPLPRNSAASYITTSSNATNTIKRNHESRTE